MIILIGETWASFIKDKDHTARQLLDGEMKVSDLRQEDKEKALMVRMECLDDDALIYFDKMIRDKENVMLQEGKIDRNTQKKWFL